MAKVLVRLSIPPRLRDGMMLKTGHPNTFDVPDTKAGAEFLNFWKTAKTAVRDAIMKRAYEEEVPIVDVKPEDTEDDDTGGALPNPDDAEDDDEDEEDD